MKPYGIITSHCSVPGHGTRCEVAEEISLGTNSALERCQSQDYRDRPLSGWVFKAPWVQIPLFPRITVLVNRTKIVPQNMLYWAYRGGYRSRGFDSH